MSVQLDPATGLPVLDTSGIIQQIPLGAPVVPFDDLSAVRRPVRSPIYPDDVVPVTAMMVGQGKNKTARAATMDDYQNLWTKESQFQSFGQVIPDGGNGPIDVNLAGNSVGVSGGSPYVVNVTQPGSATPTNAKTFIVANGCDNVSSEISGLRYLTASAFTFHMRTVTGSGDGEGELDIFAIDTNNPLAFNNSIMLHASAHGQNTFTGGVTSDLLTQTITFNPPIDLFTTLKRTTSFWLAYHVDVQFSGYMTHVFFGYS